MFSKQKFSLRKSRFESLENVQSNATIIPEDLQENGVRNYKAETMGWVYQVRMRVLYAENTHHCLVTTWIFTDSFRLSVNAHGLAGLNPPVLQIAFVAREAFDENLSRFRSTIDDVLLKTLFHFWSPLVSVVRRDVKQVSLLSSYVQGPSSGNWEIYPHSNNASLRILPPSATMRCEL